MLSRAKTRNKVQLLNFEPDNNKVNEPALEEMDQLRRESIFSWQHPLIEMTGTKMCLFNIRSWNAHIKHFLTDKVFIENCSLICLTETHCHDEEGPLNNIEPYAEGWTAIHKITQHGLAICYNVSKVNIIEEFQTTHALEMLPVLVDIDNERILVVLVYCVPGPLGTFINDLIEQLNNLPTRYRTVVIGDFNLDQMLSENIEKFNPLIMQFNFHQRSMYSTHIYGGILDLVFDNNKSECVEWIPSPYSDHFVILIQL